MESPTALNIYTDGSCLPSPRRGGIGVRFVFPDDFEIDNLIWDFEYSGYPNATNNEMEIKACIVAIKEAIKAYVTIKPLPRILLHTDSIYVQSNYIKALKQWPENDWRNKQRRPIANAHLWKEFRREFNKLNNLKRVEIEYIKGHSKNIHNRAVDRLARKSAKNPSNVPLHQMTVRRKYSDEPIVEGSIEMKGQKIAIHIITDEYLREQQEYKYNYEVISPKSKYYPNADKIYYEQPLRACHNYLVSLNKNNAYPKISKVYKEIEKGN